MSNHTPYWVQWTTKYSVIPALEELRDIADVIGEELYSDLSRSIDEWIVTLSTKYDSDV